MPFSIRPFRRFPVQCSVAAITFFSLAACTHSQSVTPGQLPTVESPRTDYAGRGGPQVATSVVRVVCKAGTGTGFVHKSGWVVTAAHVLCGRAEIPS
jgi:S1-C subfamily serine protease